MVTATETMSEESRNLRDQAAEYKRLILTGCKTWIQTETEIPAEELERLSDDLAQHIAGNLVFALHLTKKSA